MTGALIARAGDGRTRRLRVGGLIHRGGGAGRICAVAGDPAAVVKLYHEPAAAGHYKPKILAMLARPPDLPAIEEGGRRYIQIAWPSAIVEDASGGFLGFTMPFIDLGRADSLDTLLIKALRRHRGLPENYAYRLFAAQNAASMVTELHRLGHYVIDLKPQNLSVYKDNMYVAVVDCDGLSIDGGDGRRFPGHQFTDGYRCPEGARNNLEPSALGEQQDRFALAVVLFQLLNNGVHPFQGVPRRRGANLGTEQDRINAGLYAYGPSRNRLQGPSPASIHGYLEDATLALFRRAFESGYRPSAREWRDHLRQLIEGLVRCPANPAEHAHFSKGCGLCVLDRTIRARTRAAGEPRPRIRRRPRAIPRLPRLRVVGRPTTRAAPWAWGSRHVGGWLWRGLRGWLVGLPGPTPPLRPAGWGGALIVAYLVYALFAANLLAIAGILIIRAAPQEFYWLVDLAEALGAVLDEGGSKLAALVLATVFYIVASTFVGLFLAYEIRKPAIGTLVESHLTWIIRSFWYFLPLGLLGTYVAFYHYPSGYFTMPLLGFWVIYRCARGLTVLIAGRPIPSPKALL